MSDSAIVVGASSGIGRELARELAADGYEVGLAARSLDRLRDLGEELPTESYVARLDVTDPEEARDRFHRLADAMGGVDLVVANAGTAHVNPDLDWGPERETIDVNVGGFAAIATAAMDRFEERGSGHLVGVSSVAAHVGNGDAPAYGASKAFVSNYLSGLRARAAGTDVSVTTIEPGYVDTDLMLDDDAFWVASPETAAEQIADAIRAKRSHAYVTRRWRLVAWLLKAVPESVLQRVFS
ncbi:SDR family NAD(P)-dependent oxidoreductase [Halostella sp. JP-L12]|uniref:SDR family NAD(P)-dependent oxidoreductase n=1 Tax=Halostella TaxID=1843185 RepID=UPI000EF80695|nr:MULTISPECIES: SDR family NAD(P)-dependent oxidoreductase [Halostella]NHN48985.1 SDR family NAD(P)-dependent oxidoreductase [Halostella sp. JP-L12]